MSSPHWWSCVSSQSRMSMRQHDYAYSFSHLHLTVTQPATRRLPPWLFLIGSFGGAKPRQLLSQYAKQPARRAALRLVSSIVGIPPPAFTLALSLGLFDEPICTSSFFWFILFLLSLWVWVWVSLVSVVIFHRDDITSSAQFPLNLPLGWSSHDVLLRQSSFGRTFFFPFLWTTAVRRKTDLNEKKNIKNETHL